MSELIDHARANMNLGGVHDHAYRLCVEDLLFTLERHGGVDHHKVIDLFARLARLENLPAVAAVERARHDPGSLRPWQRFLLSCLPEKDFVPVPDYARAMPAQWRLGTWDNLASDTVHCYGTMMPAVLSMAYRPGVVVEMGVHTGSNTLLFCKMNPQARVYGVDAFARTRDAHLPIGFTALMNGVKNLTLAIMNSWDFSLPGQVGLCFIDADHNGDAPYKDSMRAWENRNASGDWCIAWDDYHPNNPDVKNAVDRFVGEVGMELRVLNSWVYIGSKPHSALGEFL